MQLIWLVCNAETNMPVMAYLHEANASKFIGKRDHQYYLLSLNIEDLFNMDDIRHLIKGEWHGSDHSMG